VATETLRIKVVGLREINKVSTAVNNLDKKIKAINKQRVTGTSSALKLLKEELSLKNQILKADQQILKARNNQTSANRRNVATQTRSTGGVSAVRGGGGGGGGGGALSSAIISGAFPLLFGQGPLVAGAGAIGGGVGSLVGGQMGGFAGGLAATSAVTAIQNFSLEISKLGQALNERTKDVQAVVQSLGVAGTQFEENIQVLQKLGLEEEAFAQARNKMIDLIGNDGVEAVTNFGKDFQELGNQFAKIMTLMKSKFAEFVEDSGILKFLGTKVERTALKGQAEKTGQFDDSAQGREIQKLLKTREFLSPTGGLNPKDRKELILNLTNQERGSAFGGGINERDEINARKIVNDLIVAEQQIINTKKEGIRLDESAKSIVTGKVNALKKEFDFKQTLLPLTKEEREIEIEMQKIREAVKEIKGEEATLDEKAIRDQLQKNKDLEKELELTQKIEDAFKSLSDSINNDIKNGIAGLIKGTSTLGDMLNNIANKFLDVALNQALFGSILGSGGEKGGGLLGAIGLFANGGRPPVGKPSIVGEKGPELFVPRSSGTIVPNNKLGGGGSTNVVVNVDASGTDVQGDEAQARELGTLISIAVKGELVKQQRPGGLLNR
jgi:hypothetical protein